MTVLPFATGDETPVDQPGITARLIELSRRIASMTAADRTELTATALATACELVPGARWASLTQAGGPAKTPAATHEIAQLLDNAQYRTGGGPCLHAIQTGAVVASDFAADDRWPEFSQLALANSPARAALSYPLVSAGHAELSLNFYLDEHGDSSPAVLSLSALVAAGFAIALTAIKEHDHAEQLQIALESSRQIGAAMGVLMASHRVTSEQAFDLLRTASQNTHRKLRDIAEDVLFTGVLPRAGV